jgi:Protein of unknown function (DUF2752)
MRRDTLHGAFWWGVLALAFATVLIVSFVVSPEDITSGAVTLAPPCPMRLLLQRDCPTCGMTRAFAALGHGHLSEALYYNRAAPIVFLGCFAAMLLGMNGLYRSICAYRRALPRRLT